MWRVLLTVLLLPVGCTTHTQLGESSKPSSPRITSDTVPLEGYGQFRSVLQGKVQVFFNESLLKNVVYVPVVGIQVTGPRHETTRTSLIDRMKMIASKNGADALYVGGFEEEIDYANLQRLQETRPKDQSARVWGDVFSRLFKQKTRDEQIRDSYLLTGSGIAIKIIERMRADSENSPKAPATRRANSPRPL